MASLDSMVRPNVHTPSNCGGINDYCNEVTDWRCKYLGIFFKHFIVHFFPTLCNSIDHILFRSKCLLYQR